MDKIGTAVIGAGAVGLAIAAELSRDGQEVFVFEKQSTFGQDASSRSSEVIHGGFYYPPEEFRARLCLEGRELLYQTCSDAGIPHRRLGKLVVGRDDEDREMLEILRLQGAETGIDDLHYLSRKELDEYSPLLKARHALHSPSTGIIDSHSLMKYLETRIRSQGSEILYRSEVVGLEKRQTDYLLTLKDADGNTEQVLTDTVINSAGLFSDRIAAMVGIDIVQAGYELYYYKGEFTRLSRPELVPRDKLIYPVLKLLNKMDVHTVLDMQGGVKLGPLGGWIEKEVNYTMIHTDIQHYYDPIKDIFPQIKPEHLSLDTCGIAPKRDKPGELTKDFVICHERDRGMPGLVNLIGIQSPGLTSCLAIAKEVSRQLQ